MDIKNTLIGIWGFGRVGQAAARFFTAHNISFLVWDDALTIPHSAKSLDELLNTCDAILPSPGIDINPYLDQATWLNELDIFGHYFHKKIIAITGTVGKTTITTMITESLKNAGWRAIAAGNIGVPCFDIIEKQNELDVVVLEVSSFQLEHCKTFTPDLAIWTNFFPNHIDRHKTIDNYFNAKLNLLVRQTKNQHAILPVDLKDKIPALEPHVYYVTELGLDQNKVITQKALEIVTKKIHPVIYTPLEHRCEKIAIIKNATFINDSKSTTPQSTLAAIEQYKDKKIILFLGGLSKGIDRTDLIAQLKKYTIHVLCFGKEAEQLKKICDQFMISAASFATLDQAFKECTQIIDIYDCILFSPAGSSFDLFKNYEDRGLFFKNLVITYQRSIHSA